jgi:hypothetical protein
LKPEEIKFPYYGQALFDRVSGKPEDQVAEIIIKGPQQSSAEREFTLAMLKAVAKKLGATQDEIDAVDDALVIEKGIQNWEAVQRVLVVLDRYVPTASTATIAAATQDVYQYLFNPVIAKAIDAGVRAAMHASGPIVVVAHSLGTVVAYKMLKEMAQGVGWKVPLFVTLGSPLGVTAIRKRLQPLSHPAFVGKWFNAMDERDVVALYPLDKNNFGIRPPIENKTDVDNFTENRHGIEGYLQDETVAKRIHEALTS